MPLEKTMKVEEGLERAQRMDSGRRGMAKKLLRNLNIPSLAIAVLFWSQSIFAAWEVHEETFVDGSISGTIKQGSIIKMRSGTIYEVTGLTLQLVLELSPEALVLKDGDVYKLIINGFDEPLIARSIGMRGTGDESLPEVIESTVAGEFSGWDGETIIKLTNGQIWEQSAYHYEYHYAYRPGALIFKSGKTYFMRVDGLSKAVAVRRLK